VSYSRVKFTFELYLFLDSKVDRSVVRYIRAALGPDGAPVSSRGPVQVEALRSADLQFLVNT